MFTVTLLPLEKNSHFSTFEARLCVRGTGRSSVSVSCLFSGVVLVRVLLAGGRDELQRVVPYEGAAAALAQLAGHARHADAGGLGGAEELVVDLDRPGLAT